MSCLRALFALQYTPLLPELVRHVMLDLKLLHMKDAAIVKCEDAIFCTSDDMLLDEADWPQPHTMLRWEVRFMLVFSPRDDCNDVVRALFMAALTKLCKCDALQEKRAAIRA